MTAALFSCFFWQISIGMCVLLMVPLILDGGIQMKTAYESNNRRRFLTGILFGYALVMIIAVTSKWSIRYGIHIGRELSR